MAKNEPLAEQLRTEIEKAEVPLLHLAKQSGVSAGALSRFMRRERGLGLESVEKLVPVLGLSLTLTKQGKKAKE